MQFTNDELILTLISLVRAVNPRMLQSGPDGFTVDLAPLENKSPLSTDEQLLLKLRASFQAADAEGKYTVNLDTAESSRLVASLGALDELQTWPEDVQALNRGVRERLAGSR